MKLALYGDYRPGIIVGDEMLDISSIVPGAASGTRRMARDGQDAMVWIIANWARVRRQITDSLSRVTKMPLVDIDLRAPLPSPRKVLCMSVNYREYTNEPPLPIGGFLASPDAILDPGGTILLPELTFPVCHHEAELVAVIGAEARNVSRDRALDHVFGYTAGVDVSVRGPLGSLGKSFDTFKPLGPCIVTKDEIVDPQHVQVQLSVNGALRQNFDTSDMGHDIAACLAWWSKIVTLRPGDILYTGTNHQGIGPLQNRDRISLNIEKIGDLHIQVEDPLQRSWVDGIDESVGTMMRKRIRDAVRSSDPVVGGLIP